MEFLSSDLQILEEKIMIIQNFKFGIRSLMKDKKSTILLIFGLTISLVAVILIALWITDEVTYNRSFKKSDRTYQLVARFDKDLDKFTYSSPAVIANHIKTDITGIEEICRIQKSALTSFRTTLGQFNEEGIFADNSFIDIFTPNIDLQNDQNLFPSDHSIVITETLAKKLFKNIDPIGQSIQLELDWILKTGDEAFNVSGVIKDFPENSSLKGSFILPYNLLKRIKGKDFESEWGNFQTTTFILLNSNTEAKDISKQLTTIQKSKFGTDDENTQGGLYNKFEYRLQNIQNLTLYSPTGEGKRILLVYTFLILGLAILSIACVNYVNLVTAKATKRSKEIGLKKIIGASKKHLFFQYIFEAIIVFAISMFSAILIAYLLMPFFNQLAEKQLHFSFRSIELYFVILITFITSILLAGIYPATLFSSQKLSGLLKSSDPSKSGKSIIRKTLIVVQITSTVMLIIGSIVFEKQIQFMRKKDLGYDKENVFLFEQKNFLPHYEAVRNDLEKESGILGVTAASSDLTNFGSETADISWKGKTANQTNFFITQVGIDRNFTKVMGIPLVDGKGFTGTASDSNYVYLNESAIQQMAIKDPIGKSIELYGKNMIIAAVMKDFNFTDLKTAIKPCVFFLGNGFALGGMYVKASPNETQKAVAAVQRLWAKYNPDYTFQYNFLDESFDKLYKTDLVSGKLISILTIIAIILSCMGLAGMIVFTTELKVKEIGIRKTLGATVNNILLIIVKDYFLLIGISFLIAFPISWLILSKWLENYIYRTSINYWVFLVTAAITMILAFITIAKISMKAAKANPINSLRNE